MIRLTSTDPWTHTRSPRWRRRILGFVLALGLVASGVVLGRASVSPGDGRSLPALAAWASRMSGDVPVGYSHTREGMVAAATNYSAVLAGPLVLEPGRYRAAEDVIASPSARAAVRAEGEQAVAAVDESTRALTEARRGVQVVVRYTPVAYRLTAYDGNRGVVSIWALWLVGEQGLLAPTETWSTRTVVLEWTGGDWKLASSSTSAGPTPQLGQAAARAAELPPQLTDFEEYAHASR